MRFPGLVIAGLRGGSGKTVLSLGIAAAWKDFGIKIAPFKKGPDYIDAGWLSHAAGRPCYNLDTFLCSSAQVRHTFQNNFTNADIAVVEGNRGLYDGIDTDGSTSTAEIAKLLNLPVLLVLDCTKSTRTQAALLMGCVKFDPGVTIMGVILNRVAGPRHEGKIRDNIKKFCNVPVFGAIPKLKAKDFPERHMGLIPSAEHQLAEDSIKAAAAVAKKSIDLEGLYRASIDWHEPAPAPGQSKTIPEKAKHFPSKAAQRPKAGITSLDIQVDDPPVIGIIRDSAFQFYYPDNLEALESLGAKLIIISPLQETTLPKVDAVYMGGGFPETHAAELAANDSFRNHLKELALNGLPIYAECGGLIFLGNTLILDGKPYPMTGVFPIVFGLSKRPEGHGYTTVTVTQKNPFYPVGEVIRGHEFRYSSIQRIDYQPDEMAFSMDRGRGIIDKLDGFFKNNVFATYTHILASGTPSWAKAIVNKALRYKQEHHDS